MLRVKNLSKDYDGFVALQNASFELEKGTILGLIGENGAGKSTIIKILSGLIEPSSGIIEYFGMDFGSNKSMIKRRIGYLPEVDSLYENMNPLEYLLFFASLYGISTKEAKKRAYELIEMLNIPANRPISEFSKGMKRKVSIARTLIHHPDILIYDEPTGGLDPSTSLFIAKFMRNLREQGKAILFSAHNMYYVESVCDRIIILKEGKVLYYGSIDELRQNKKYILHYLENGRNEVFETSSIEELNTLMRSLISSGSRIIRIDSEVARLEDIYFSILEDEGKFKNKLY